MEKRSKIYIESVFNAYFLILAKGVYSLMIMPLPFMYLSRQMNCGICNNSKHSHIYPSFISFFFFFLPHFLLFLTFPVQQGSLAILAWELLTTDTTQPDVQVDLVKADYFVRSMRINEESKPKLELKLDFEPDEELSDDIFFCRMRTHTQSRSSLYLID